MSSPQSQVIPSRLHIRWYFVDCLTFPDMPTYATENVECVIHVDSQRRNIVYRLHRTTLSSIGLVILLVLSGLHQPFRESRSRLPQSCGHQGMAGAMGPDEAA